MNASVKNSAFAQIDVRKMCYVMSQGILVKVGRGQYEFFEPMFRDYVMQL